MINRIIAYSIENKLIIGLLTVALVIAGIWSMNKVPLDAVPDITNNQVQVITQASNLGTEDIEQFITYPIELGMANLPGVTEIRSISRFGLSVVTIVFEDDMGIYLPRQLVMEKLVSIRDDIPEEYGNASMGPIATGLGEIYQYTIQVDSAYRSRYSISELRSIQDWIIRRQMAMVPGVIEVNAFGGATRQYEVAVDPDELNAIGLSITDVFEALEQNNRNTGGAYIEKNHMANFIRGEGLARSLDDVKNIVIKTVEGIPIRVQDVASVRFGSAIRYGAFTQNGQGEAVGGTILMLTGANSREVITAVKEKVELIEESLPPGITIEPFLDRSNLIAKTTSTVKTNLLEGALIVIFILVFLLGNWRGGLIVASTIPLSLLFAFIMMNAFDVWANLMSLGAIDFGIIVDGAVIIVEATVFSMAQHFRKNGAPDGITRDKITFESSSKMMNAAFFGQLIILIVFIPILFLEGVEGKMFKPMALTFMFAMIGAMILCLTYIPMVSALTLRQLSNNPTWGDKIVHWLEEKYDKILARVMRKSVLVIGFASALMVVAIILFTRLGGEFIPQLDEGDIAFHIILKPGSSLSEGVETSTQIENILLNNFPEIEHVMSRFGVSDVATDPMPMDMADCFIILKPKSEWVSASSKEELIEKFKEAISIKPGVGFEFTQPIEMRFNELITGVREDVAVKLYGEDLDILADKAAEIARIISDIDGIADMKVEATEGLPQMTVHYDRNDLAQYGLNVNNVNRILEAAFAGGKAGVIFEGEKRFDLVVRFDSASRTGINDVKDLFINTPGGAQIPLREIAQIDYRSGPMQISRDNTNRRTYVGINVRGRDIKSLVEEIRARLDNELTLPPGYYIRFGGAFENLERATQRLQLVVPISLGLIFILIFLALRSLRETVMIYVAIPLAAIGGVFSLWLRDMPFSISAGVGFIVLFGVAVLNGLVLISGWNELKNEGVTDVQQRTRMGARRRIRPILLTALADIFGFLPMAISTSAGAEVQRPLATVVIGGMITSTLLTLFILPVLYRWTESRFNPTTMPKGFASLTVVLMICFAPSAKAQIPDTLPELRLEEAIEKAIANYPALKSARLEVEQQEVLKKTALDLGNTQLFTSGEEINENGDGVYTPIGFQQQNMDVFGVASKKKMQITKVRLAEAAYQLSALQLTRQVKEAYANVLVARQNVLLYQSLDSVYRSFERAARLRYEVEETSKLAFLAASNQVKQIELLTDQITFDYGIALSRFNLWFVSDTMFTASLHPDDSWTRSVLAIDSISSHPQLRMAEQRISVANAERRVAEAGLFPKLNAQYGLQEIVGEPGFHQFQVGISIPLFFMQDQGRIQSAKIERQIAEQAYVQTQLELQMQYQSTVSEYRKWLASWKFYQEEALPLAVEQREGTIIAYREGEIDYVTFIQNLKEAVQVELNAQQAFLKYLQTRFQLEYFLNTIEE